MNPMAARKSEPSVDKLRFEDALEALEQLIERIESGEIGLEESLAQYERGMKLIRRCQSILDTAEKRIAELTEIAGGELVIEAEEDEPEADAEDEPDEDDADAEAR